MSQPSLIQIRRGTVNNAGPSCSTRCVVPHGHSTLEMTVEGLGRISPGSVDALIGRNTIVVNWRLESSPGADNPRRRDERPRLKAHRRIETDRVRVRSLRKIGTLHIYQK